MHKKSLLFIFCLLAFDPGSFGAFPKGLPGRTAANESVAQAAPANLKIICTKKGMRAQFYKRKWLKGSGVGARAKKKGNHHGCLFNQYLSA
jgi:hypothetical protein